MAAQLRAPQTAGGPLIGGLPEGLAMEMVANGLFHSNERPDVLLARTRMLCLLRVYPRPVARRAARRECVRRDFRQPRDRRDLPRLVRQHPR